MSYQLGVDLGLTCSAAAVCRADRAAPPELVPLADRTAILPTVVFVNDDGSLLAGEEAERRALTDPGRVVRQFTRRIGDSAPLLIGGAGGTAVMPEALAARFVSRVVDIVAARMGGAPSRIALTHPAGWGTHRIESLREALAAHGLGGTVLLSGPQAAALAHASREPVSPGDPIAVYDLGGAGFQAAVLRKVGPDQFALFGRPEEIERGGLDFDEVVFSHVTSTLGAAWTALDPTDPMVQHAVAELRTSCRIAKETLSADTDVLIPVALPGIETEVRLGRSELEELIRPVVDETVAALHRAVRAAGPNSDALAAVLLVGGSARIPLITQAVSAQFGRPVTVSADPKGIIAIGAALAARGPENEQTSVGLWPVPAPVPVLVPIPTDWRSPADPLPRRPVPVGPPVARKRALLPRGLPRTVAVGFAAAALAAITVVGGMALNNRIGPADADADPATGQSTNTVVPQEDPSYNDTPTVREVPRTKAATQPPRTRTTTRTSPRTTTGKPVETSTTPTTTTTTTTTTTVPPCPPGQVASHDVHIGHRSGRAARRPGLARR